MKLTEAMATLDNAYLMPPHIHYSSYWASNDSTSFDGRFLVTTVNIAQLESASVAQELDGLGIRIVYILGSMACFEFSEEIEGDVL